MKIAGIAGKKHPTLKRGDAIEMSPDDKLMKTAMDVFIKETEDDEMVNTVLSMKIKGKTEVIKGRSDMAKTKADPHQYKGIVLLTYRPTHKLKDYVRPKLEAEVFIHFIGDKDDIGMPDTKVLDFKIIRLK